MRRFEHAWPRVAALLICAALLSGCTYSEALRRDEFWPLRPLPPAASREPAVFYATDRQPDDAGFGLRWGGALRCGRMVLTVGPVHGYDVAPAAEAPQSCDAQAALDAFARKVADAARGCSAVLVMVHGYNATFRNAVLRSGQMAADMHWRCATLLFSWSSEGLFNRYAADIERSSYATPSLEALLRALAGRGLRLDIMAHSMGARIALSALGHACRETPGRLADELVLAAPDVNAEPGNDDFGQFLKQVAPCARRTTIYASDNDMALIGSRSVHGGIPRAGLTPAEDLQYLGGAYGDIDVIDASSAPGDLAGHGYFSLAYEMTDDMAALAAGHSLAQRVAAGSLRCKDGKDSSCAAGGGVYQLAVAPERRPDFSTRLLRRVWPFILPLR